MISARKKIPFAASLTLAFALFAPPAFAQIILPPPSESGGPMVTVLCYHHVDCAVKTEYSVTSEQLSAQIDALRSVGFTFIDSAALEAFYLKGEPIPAKSALVTFDDGNLDVYRRGFPLLRKKGVPFTFFVYPNAVNAGHEKHCVDWDDLRAMAAAGVTIGSHTMTHPFLSRPPETVANAADYEEWLRNELVLSRAEIEVKLGQPVTEFAVPFGAFDSRIKGKIRAAGYALAFNVNGTNADSRADRWNIGRIIVKASMSMESFLEVASAPPLYFSATEPAELSRVNAAKTVISFALDDAPAYDESSVQSHVTSFSGLDLQHVKEGDRFIASLDFRRPSFYEVYVQAKDRSGRLCRGSWLFIYERKTPAYLEPATGLNLNKAAESKAKRDS